MTGRALRVLLVLSWAALPFTLGPTLGAALDDRDLAVRLVASTSAWLVWAVGVVATLVPHPLGLTWLRLAAPAACVMAAWTAANGHVSAGSVGGALAVAAAAFAPETGMLLVNGPAYPNERRFPLRVPAPLLLGPLPLAAAAVAGLPIAAALLLAARQWLLGAAAAAAAVAALRYLGRSVHTLSKRWLVFVPAGVVLVDPLSLADPVLFQRRVVDTLRPAPAGSDSLDLTQRSLGLALELVLREKVPMVLVRPGKGAAEPGSSARLLFTPTRPGAVLAEARERRLPVG